MHPICHFAYISIIYCWNELNRLQGSADKKHNACYLYDAGGDRFYKFSGTPDIMYVNGQWHTYLTFSDPTLYASPYLVATSDGYTKHYFVENERFASRIGDGTITGLNTHAATASVLTAKQAKVNDAITDSILANSFGYLPSLPFNWSSHHTTYWQHSDHLGSASWVTDTNGLGYQHFQYRAWGEPFIDQRATTNGYETRYTFSGKERDEETGYSYFGARYYNSALSIWLSVDPMSDKYPSMSPYTYCADNPVKLVDPDGREIGDYYSSNGQWIGNDGIDDKKVYQAAAGGSVTFGLGVLNETQFEYVGEVDETILKYEGTMHERSKDEPYFKGSISIGELNIVQKVGDNEFVKERYSALSGGWGNGSIENGEYSVNNLRDNRDGSYKNYGIGFSFDVIPNFKTCRTDLRIHPDGGTMGTLGCIGLTGDATELTNFRNSLNSLLKNANYIKLHVTIDGNPNRNGCQ